MIDDVSGILSQIPPQILSKSINMKRQKPQNCVVIEFVIECLQTTNEISGLFLMMTLVTMTLETAVL